MDSAGFSLPPQETRERVSTRAAIRTKIRFMTSFDGKDAPSIGEDPSCAIPPFVFCPVRFVFRSGSEAFGLQWTRGIRGNRAFLGDTVLRWRAVSGAGKGNLSSSRSTRVPLRGVSRPAAARTAPFNASYHRLLPFASVPSDKAGGELFRGRPEPGPSVHGSRVRPAPGQFFPRGGSRAVKGPNVIKLCGFR